MPIHDKFKYKNHSHVSQRFHWVTNYICICLCRWVTCTHLYNPLPVCAGWFYYYFSAGLLSKHCQYKIEYLVIKYSEHILINKNNTRHRKRSHNKWRHQCQTNAFRNWFCQEKIFVWLFAMHLCYMKDIQHF